MPFRTPLCEGVTESPRPHEENKAKVVRSTATFFFFSYSASLLLLQRIGRKPGRRLMAAVHQMPPGEKPVMAIPRVKLRERGRAFKTGNPGRPPGSKNKVTRALEQLAEGQAEQLTQKLLELALAGDVTCLRIALDRIWPVRK